MVERHRAFILTAFENAECYNDLEAIIESSNCTLFAVIKHDKDITPHGEPKTLHKHAVLEFKNARAFNSVRSKFEGAHIEICKYPASAYRYLVHDTPASEEEGKHKYSIDEIYSNNLESVRAIIELVGYESFISSDIMLYIAQGTTTAFRFYQRFGFEAFAKHWKTYHTFLANCEVDPEARTYIETLKEKAREETQDK